MNTPAEVSRPKYFVGPGNRSMTVADLPAPDTKRWVSSRKAVVVTAVRGNYLSREEACSRYNLSEEEYLSWEHRFDQDGVKGLNATRIQQYRRPKSAKEGGTDDDS